MLAEKIVRSRAQIFNGSANLAIRGMSLVFRFGLAFYMVSYLGLEATGIYGLTCGIIAIVPALIGWGLNYFVAREVVGKTPDVAAPLIRNRLLITFCSLSMATILCALAGLFVPHSISVHILIIIAVLTWFETFALDFYTSMIGLGLAFQANLLLFIRSAAWVPVIVALGLLSTMFRSIEAVLLVWIASHLVALGALWLMMRRWPIAAQLKQRVEFQWAVTRMQRNWYIYLSDIGIALFLFVDRYIVSFMLGLAATGVYSFYWSIANAIQTLINSAVVQIALPRMVFLFRSGDITGWHSELKGQVIKTAALSFVISLGIFGATEFIVRIARPGHFPDNLPLFAFMLAAAVARACSDLLNVAITSSGRDRYYAMTNFLGMFLVVLLCVIFIYFFGLVGTGMAAFGAATSLALIRLWILRRVRM